MKKKISVVGIICLVMIGLSGLLLAVESGAESSSIKTYGDALWYMIVTLTTVGYGDLYPVTMAGKIIGVLFILASMGMLGAILATMITVFNSGIIPLFLLKLYRNERWYVFSELNEKTGYLIEDMKKNNKGFVL